MRVPLAWLAEYCDPGVPAEALAERLAMTGTAVDRILHHGVGALEFFVVGEVLSAEQHPDADRLRVCSVEVGTGEPSTIVCGAPNVAAGQTVAVARPGAVMPDGTRLKAAKLRGMRSEGMILAEDELAIGTDHDGILVLDGARPGTPLLEVLPGIATEVLELEITPNRPDCLGIYGVAREVHAATGAPLAPPPWADDPTEEGDAAGIEITVEVPDLCPRFTARSYADVRIGPSPPWLKARLMAAGQRPISNVVDITNYVMLLTGQPLHAFDADRIAGGCLVVRSARDAEEVETLDGQVRRLTADMVVIEDADGPTSIAGVMGGARSEVGEGTTRVLMEVATWNGPNIKRTSEALGLRSEASGRYEKGLEPEQTLWAQAVARKLMVELCGARPVGGTVDVGGPGPAPVSLHLREARVTRLLGRRIPRERCGEILTALGFTVDPAGDGLNASVPDFRRSDVTREADLIEEVARIDGLERLPATVSPGKGAGRLTPRQELARRAADTLAARGLHEVVGWSFSAPALADALRLGPEDPRRRAVELENPLSEDASVLRTLVLGSLLDIARRNVARDAGPLRLFEMGGVYVDIGEELPRERLHLGGLLSGPPRPESWREPRLPPADFFAAKGMVDGLLATLRCPAEWARTDEPFLHPGRGARVGELGWCGELHPLVAEAWDLDGPVVVWELDLDAIPIPPVPAYRDIPHHPALLRDLAVSIPEDESVGRVIGVVRAAGAPFLEEVEVFDRYGGRQAGAGRLSVAMHLRLRASDRTLTDDEAQTTITRVLSALLEQVGAASRD